jgi:hypothetical protein
MTFRPPDDVVDVEPGGDDTPGPGGGRRRAGLLRRLAARALRALARGQRNAGGGRAPLRRTPRD